MASLTRNEIALSLGLAFALSSVAIADETPSTALAVEQKAQGPKVDEKTGKTGKKDKTEPEGWHRSGFGFASGNSKIELEGYIQEDFRRFSWAPKGGTVANLAAERELKRLRIGVTGNLDKLTFEFQADPRTSQAPGRLKDVTLGYKFAKGANLLAGHFKPSFSQEFLTSAGKTDFVDRTMISHELGADRDWGVGLSGEIGKFLYSVGGFGGDGNARTQRSKSSGAGRLRYQPIKGFLISVNMMQGNVEPDPIAPDGTQPSAKSARGQTPTGFKFFDRVHVKGVRRRSGSDLSYSRGPFRLQAEYIQNQEQRKGQGSTGQDIPDVRGSGWSAQASYVLTGEKKGSTVNPEKSVFNGGRGALEIVARYETLKFDDTGDQTGFAGYGSRSRNIALSQGSIIEAGANYWVSNFLKFQGDAIWESYNDPLIPPVPGNTGRYFTLVGRIQVTIP